MKDWYFIKTISTEIKCNHELLTKFNQHLFYLLARTKNYVSLARELKNVLASNLVLKLLREIGSTE